MENAEKINEIIKKFYEENQSVTCILLASRNGLLLENTWPTIFYNKNKEIAKNAIRFSSILLSAAINISTEKIFLDAQNRRVGSIETGSMQEIILSGKYVQTIIIGTMFHFLLVYTNKSKGNKEIFQEIKSIAEKIKKLEFEVNETA